MYKVIVEFGDLADNKHRYKVGDTYPREGAKPTQDRIKELSSGKNATGKPLIEEVVEKTTPAKKEKEAEVEAEAPKKKRSK